MASHAITYEQLPNGGWSAYVEDLHGCVTAAENYTECEKLIQQAIRMHLDFHHPEDC